jgi:hypothetical protein
MSLDSYQSLSYSTSGTTLNSNWTSSQYLQSNTYGTFSWQNNTAFSWNSYSPTGANSFLQSSILQSSLLPQVQTPNGRTPFAMNFTRYRANSLRDAKKKQLTGRTQVLLMGGLDSMNQMSGVGLGLSMEQMWVNRPTYWYGRAYHSYSWTQQSSTTLESLAQSSLPMSAGTMASMSAGMAASSGGASASAFSFLPPLGGAIAPPLGGDIFSSSQGGTQGNSIAPQKPGQFDNGQGQSQNGRNRSGNGQSSPGNGRTRN